MSFKNKVLEQKMLKKWTARSKSPKQMFNDSLNLLMKGVVRKKRNIKITSVENEEKPKEEKYHPLPFDKDKVYSLMESTIEGYFKQGRNRRYRYEKADNNLICQKLSQQIKDELKSWPNLSRHRIISLVSIVENENQGIHYKMKFSLDTRNDGYIKYHLNHPQVFVLALVMLVQQD